MKIGVIADTHDNIPKIHRAIEIFNKAKVGLVIHLGDYVAPFSLKPLDNLASPWIGIFGNNDGEKKGLKVFSKNRIKNAPLNITIKNKSILAVHDISCFQKSKKFDIVLFAHTHSPEIKHEKNSIFVNPGECGGWLTHASSIAIVDLETLEPRIIRL